MDKEKKLREQLITFINQKAEEIAAEKSRDLQILEELKKINKRLDELEIKVNAISLGTTIIRETFPIHTIPYNPPNTNSPATFVYC